MDSEQKTTLARRMGEVCHVSLLWRKVSALCGLCNERACDWLLKCAIERGAAHYQRPFAHDLPPDNPALSDEEIGVALCLGQHPYNSVYVRAAAQLLSSPRVDARKLARLSKMERVDGLLNHIARLAEQYAPAVEPWVRLRAQLKPRGIQNQDLLPHWSRFVSQTGLSPINRQPEIQWLRRRETK